MVPDSTRQELTWEVLGPRGGNKLRPGALGGGMWEQWGGRCAWGQGRVPWVGVRPRKALQWDLPRLGGQLYRM